MTTNEQSLREALEPCPFCGGADDADEPRLQDHDLRGLEITFRFVECPGCGACGPRCATKRQAIKAWNTRQALSRPAMSEEEATAMLASKVEAINPEYAWLIRTHADAGGPFLRACIAAIRAASERKEG